MFTELGRKDFRWRKFHRIQLFILKLNQIFDSSQSFRENMCQWNKFDPIGVFSWNEMWPPSNRNRTYLKGQYHFIMSWKLSVILRSISPLRHCILCFLGRDVPENFALFTLSNEHRKTVPLINYRPGLGKNKVSFGTRMFLNRFPYQSRRLPLIVVSTHTCNFMYVQFFLIP